MFQKESGKLVLVFAKAVEDFKASSERERDKDISESFVKKFRFGAACQRSKKRQYLATTLPGVAILNCEETAGDRMDGINEYFPSKQSRKKHDEPISSIQKSPLASTNSLFE